MSRNLGPGDSDGVDPAPGHGLSLTPVDCSPRELAVVSMLAVPHDHIDFTTPDPTTMEAELSDLLNGTDLGPLLGEPSAKRE